ncbi:hypothetical protein BV898_15522 [Hypsibius exemplaris]|uniref:G-protein coupled receptors family 1 profile domain-containing protein n=1 Tax=Hypsibius exemplaris TaxID=2072580 RepID=A0A9X6RKJ4_HYPEX|nr:hypothetical protein BV898_15522 [Hypsibius exemplaris]
MQSLQIAWHNHTNVSSDRSNANLTFVVDEIIAKWSFESVFSLILAVTGAATNGTVLLAFVIDRRLCTPFNCLVLHLIFLDLLQSLTQNPLTVAATLYNGRWVLGNRVCDFYLLTQALLNAAVINTHALIGLNRAWSILHCQSYRLRNSRRLALQLSAGLWLYIFTIYGPFWLLDAVFYRKPVTSVGCIINSAALPVYSFLVTLIFFTFPVFAILAAFATVFVQKSVRRRRWARKKSAISPAVNLQGDVRAETEAQIQRQKKRTRRYRILLFLTGSVTVCYLPRTVSVLIKYFAPDYWNPGVHRITGIVYVFQVVVDPVLFTLTLENVRSVVVRILRCRAVVAPQLGMN